MPNLQEEKALVSFVTTAKLPEWQTKLFAKYRKDILVHSQGLLFAKIDRLFPNEDPSSKDHRMIAFEPITESSFSKGANNIHWVFQNSSYKVTCSEEVAEYLRTLEIENKNFYEYILDEWCRTALTEDANALIVVYPEEYVDEYNVNMIEFVMTENLVYYDEGIIAFKCEKESEVKYNLKEIGVQRSRAYWDESIGGPNVKYNAVDGGMFTPYVEPQYIRTTFNIFITNDDHNTPQGLYRVSQSKTDPKSYAVDFFAIEFNPTQQCGGERTAKSKIYKSFLYPFVPFGNLALLHHSQHIATNLMFAFPRMDEVTNECEAEGCVNGKVICDVEVDPRGFQDCSVCHGTGGVVPQSPYKIYRRKISSDAIEGADATLSVDSVKFYTPPTDILKYSKAEWQEYLERAESAVYIQQKVKTGNAESAESKKVDAEDKYTFNNRVGRTFYDVVRFCVQCVENYRVASPTNVVVEAPKSLAILSEDEAFVMLNNIMTSNLPVFVKANNIDSFMGKYISQSSPIRKFFDVLKAVDPLLYYTNAEIGLMKANNQVSAEQWAIHIFAFGVLQQMYTIDRKVLDIDVNKLKEVISEQVAEMTPEPPPDNARDAFLDK